MTENGAKQSLGPALTVLRARGLLIVICVVVTAGVAFGFSRSQTKQYTASAKLLFRNPGLDQQASGLASSSSFRDPQRDTATNIRLVTLGDVASRTAKALGDGTTPASVLGSVEVTPEGATDIAAVAATAPDPQRAARIANTFTQNFIGLRREVDQRRVFRARELVERQIAELAPAQRSGVEGQSLTQRRESLRILASLQTGNAELVERATPPAAASSPRVMLNTMIGGALGLLLGVSLALLLHRLDRRITDPDELQSVFDLPLLGLVPQSGAYSSTGNGLPRRELPAREREAFSLLRAHLRYFNVDRVLHTVLVTSAAPGEGKSTVSQNLAWAAVAMGTKTLLIEADMRRPTLGPRLGLAPDRGLGEVLINALPASEAIRSVDVGVGAGTDAVAPQLDVLLASSLPPNPAELIESRAMEDLLNWCSEHYDLVMIDTPPLTVVSDAISLLRKVDGVMVVSRFKSNRDEAVRLRDRLASLGAPVLGVVGNGYPEDKQGGYGYGYGYGYAAQASEEQDAAGVSRDSQSLRAGRR